MHRGKISHVVQKKSTFWNDERGLKIEVHRQYNFELSGLIRMVEYEAVSPMTTRLTFNLSSWLYPLRDYMTIQQPHLASGSSLSIVIGV